MSQKVILWTPGRVAANNWNAGFPSGTPVRYHSLKAEDHTLEDECVVTRTRSRAWVLGCDHAVVKVEGVAGGVSLEHCVVIAET